MILFILFDFIVFAACIFVLYVKAKRMNHENQLIQSYTMSMQELNQDLLKRVEATGKYRHDLKKHIDTLQMMQKQMESEQAGDCEFPDMQLYIDNLKEQYKRVQSPQYCKDVVLNSVLSLKAGQCEECGIPITIKIDQGEYSQIEPADMTGLIYNLLDNAIEATLQIPKNQPREISVCIEKEKIEKEETEKENENLVITICNYFDGKERITFRTKKDNPEEHGFGTKIIQQIIEKYHGTQEIFIDKDMHVFREKIMLAMEKEDIS